MPRAATSVVRGIARVVWKDLYLLRRSLLYLSAMVLVFSLLFAGSQWPVVFAAVVPSVVTVPNLLAYVEERNRGLAFQRCLPIPVGVIVGAKYVVALAVAAWLGAVATVAAVWRLQATSGGPTADLIAWMLAATTALMLALSGLSLWAFFRWGYQAVRYASFGAWMAVTAIAWPLVRLARASVDPGEPSLNRKVAEMLRPALDTVARWAQESPTTSMAVLIALCLGLYALSGVAAYRALRQREL